MNSEAKAAIYGSVFAGSFALAIAIIGAVQTYYTAKNVREDAYRLVAIEKRLEISQGIAALLLDYERSIDDPLNRKKNFDALDQKYKTARFYLTTKSRGCFLELFGAGRRFEAYVPGKGSRAELDLITAQLHKACTMLDESLLEGVWLSPEPRKPAVYGI